MRLGWKIIHFYSSTWLCPVTAANFGIVTPSKARSRSLYQQISKIQTQERYWSERTWPRTPMAWVPRQKQTQQVTFRDNVSFGKYANSHRLARPLWEPPWLSDSKLGWPHSRNGWYKHRSTSTYKTADQTIPWHTVIFEPASACTETDHNNTQNINTYRSYHFQLARMPLKHCPSLPSMASLMKN